MKSYLNAVRAAKINIHKFSNENQSHITHSLEFNKSFENFATHKIRRIGQKREADTAEPTQLGVKSTVKQVSKSPYRAEIFNMKGVQLVQKSGG